MTPEERKKIEEGIPLIDNMIEWLKKNRHLNVTTEFGDTEWHIRYLQGERERFKKLLREDQA